MTQKTNQFNLTTKRKTENKIAELMNKKNNKIYSVSVKDKFGDLLLTECGIKLEELDESIKLPKEGTKEYQEKLAKTHNMLAEKRKQSDSKKEENIAKFYDPYFTFLNKSNKREEGKFDVFRHELSK